MASKGKTRCIAELLEAGDHGAARAEAARVLAGPAAADEQAAARAALARIAPDPAALLTGAAGLLLYLAALIFGVLR